MFRLTALFLALVATADAFAPLATLPREPAVILAAGKEPFFLDNEGETDETDIVTDTPSPFAKPPPMNFDFEAIKEKIPIEDIKAKAEEMKEKASEFLEDDRIQELSSKATDFAKDVFDQIFSVVGEKLKDLKVAKEEAEEVLVTSEGEGIESEDVSGLDP